MVKVGEVLKINLLQQSWPLALFLGHFLIFSCKTCEHTSSSTVVYNRPFVAELVLDVAWTWDDCYWCKNISSSFISNLLCVLPIISYSNGFPIIQTITISFFPPGHSHPMDMPGRGPHDERDSGIARSGTLMRLSRKARIDLQSEQPSALQRRFEWRLMFILRVKGTKNISSIVTFCCFKIIFSLYNKSSDYVIQQVRLLFLFVFCFSFPPQPSTSCVNVVDLF